jgi:hypothetical protein
MRRDHIAVLCAPLRLYLWAEAGTSTGRLMLAVLGGLADGRARPYPYPYRRGPPTETPLIFESTAYAAKIGIVRADTEPQHIENPCVCLRA